MNNSETYVLSYMPGAGGNFLSRCLNFHPDINYHKKCVDSDYAKKYDVLNYQAVKDRRNNLQVDWLSFEQDQKEVLAIGTQNLVEPTHGTNYSNIRITNYTKKEFIWARDQALWKNSLYKLAWLKAGQVENEDLAIPCTALWKFPELATQLTAIEKHIGVVADIPECRMWQEKLWGEWKTTWAPANMTKSFDRYYYGPAN